MPKKRDTISDRYVSRIVSVGACPCRALSVSSATCGSISTVMMMVAKPLTRPEDISTVALKAGASSDAYRTDRMLVV